ncbi:DUF1835 domain-containing protein [Sorangium sp. So ce693]|uniref:DUF1835 domain-containing protein n=1 Tax=Sorangium sp. So ce693 TaxID=3133318 RepID=UPI003F61E3E8
MTTSNTLRGATHVAFDTRTTDRLLEIGATNVVRAADRLIIGPSRLDAIEHAQTREAWRSSPEESSNRDPYGKEWDQLYSSDIHWDLPVVLWASSSLHERVNLWRTCNWLRQLEFAYRDVLILDFNPVRTRIPEKPMPPFDCSASVSDHPDEVLLERLSNARPWLRERYNRAVRLWDLYTNANPLPFAQSCARGVKGFPELAPLWALMSSFLPILTTKRALRLSRFDELILTLLSAEWQTPAAVAVHKSQLGMELWQLLSCTGDLFLVDRLEQWADHDSSAAVERAPGPKPSTPMKSFVYRLTERGMKLREGLDHLADAPSLPMAGIEAYSTSSPWVLLEDGRLARL